MADQVVANTAAPAQAPVAEVPKKNKLLAFSERHPYILLAVVIVMIVAIGYFMLKDYCWGDSDGKSSTKAKKKKKSGGGEADSEKEQIDDLIASINSKQKNACSGDGGEAPAQE